jgi:hypothetical protein
MMTVDQRTPPRPSMPAFANALMSENHGSWVHRFGYAGSTMNERTPGLPTWSFMSMTMRECLGYQ